MELIESSSTEGSYSYDIEGYVQTSYINITANKVDGYVNNAGYLDLNANATASVTSDPLEAGDHGFNYKCHIDISGMFEIDFNLPNFLSVPGVNLTLFKKMNIFSKQVSNLNDNMIAFIQSTGCCDISYEYNKTVVPIFRYLADHPDTIGCNTQDPKVEEGDKCADGSSENLMSAILKVITQITKVYTAIEPIFCIIKPIPGNPWLPMDFNWIRPILPYIEKFGKFSEKVMSGELIDVIIEPVKDINRNLFNCRQDNVKMVVDKTISSTVIINSINEIQSAQDFQAAYDELKGDSMKAQVAALETVIKYTDDTSLGNEFKALGELLYEKEKYDIKKKELLIGRQTDLEAISTKLNLARTEQDKVSAYFLADKNRPLQCLQEIMTFRPDLPKLPWITVSLLPEPGRPTSLRNDLIPLVGEKAYDITYKDIYGDTTDFSNSKVINEKIRFDKDTVHNAEFIKKFRKYINDDGETRTYMALQNSSKWKEYLENGTLTAESFDTGAIDSASDYFTNKSTLEGVMDRDFDLWDTGSLLFSEESAKPEVILGNNSQIADQIYQVQEEESVYVNKLRDMNVQDKFDWNYYRLKAKSILFNIKQEYRKEGEDIGDTTSWTDWNWWEYFSRGISSYTVEKAELTFWSTFGNYQEIDMIKDPWDETNTDAYSMYIDENSTPALIALQEVVNAYIVKRKNRLGDVAKTHFNNEVAGFTTEAQLLLGQVTDIQNFFYSLSSQMYDIWEAELPLGVTGELVTMIPYSGAPNTEYMHVSDSYSLAEVHLKDTSTAEYTEYKNLLDALTNNSLYSKLYSGSAKILSAFYKEIVPGVFVHQTPIEVDDTSMTVIGPMVEGYVSNSTNELPLNGSDSTAPNMEGYLLRIFKYERIKKEFFETIDDNAAYKFYVVFNPEITLGCNIICELIQFVVNYLLAIIKKLLMMLIYWLIDYLVPDWLKNLIRLILYKLKCFLMMAYNVSSDPEKNRLLKIDNTFDAFMEAIKNRVQLYPYDACAKTALENATAEAALDNDDTSDATSDTQVEAAVAHEISIFFANVDLTQLQAISRYNYEDIKIVIKKDMAATLNNLIIRDYDDVLTGPSATDITIDVNAYDPEVDVDTAEHWYITTAANGDIIINNLDLSLLNTAMTMVSTDSYKSTATVTDKYDAHIVSNRYSTLNVASSVIQLQDKETKSFLTLLDNNKRYLKIMFKKEPESDIISLTLTDNTPYVTAAVATATTDEIIGSTPLTSVRIELSEYEITYDSIYNLSYIIYDCTDFFPTGNDITGTLVTMFNGLSSTVQDSILCMIDNTTVGSTGANVEEEVVINDTLITSPPVSNPGVNPDPQDAADLADAGVSQARTETPIIYNCFNSSGTITELLEANYEAWIALGLIPDPNAVPELPEEPEEEEGD